MKQAVIFLLMILSISIAGHAQESYNSCFNALELCPNQSYSVNNIGAYSTSCVNCEDDFNYCFTSENSIWMNFTTNATGGNVSIDFSNLVFETNPGQGLEMQAALIEASTPCDAGSYTQVGSCHSTETVNFSLTAAGLAPNTSYYLVLDGNNIGAGITSPAEFTLDVSINGASVDRPISSLDIVESSTSICFNESVSFTCLQTQCPDNGQFYWYINGELAATTVDSVFQTTELLDGDTVTVQTDCYTDCPVTTQITSAPISVFVIDVNAGTDVTVASGTSFPLNGSTTAPVFYWSPSFAVSDPNVLNPIVTPTETTTYALTAEQNGCVRTDYVTATILSELEIPNTFSPNGDELNDTWIIEGLEKYPDNLVSIYSRWGQRVFHTSAYSKIKNWDGGNSLEGVYYYIIELNDGSEGLIKGTITLLR